MKKKILALFLTVITVFWVGACGNTSEKNDVGQGPKEAEGGENLSSQGQSGEENITLRYAYWGSSYENEAMQKIAAKYEEENPNVKIECIYIPNADYTTKMTAMVASGDEPDIANLFPSDFIGWADEDRFVNLYEMIEKDDRYEVEDFIPNCFFEISEGYAGGVSPMS